VLLSPERKTPRRTYTSGEGRLTGGGAVT